MDRPDPLGLLFIEEDGEAPQPEMKSPDASATNTSLRRLCSPILHCSDGA